MKTLSNTEADLKKRVNYKKGVYGELSQRVAFYPEAAIGGVLQKVVLKNFAKFTWKHLCQSLLYITPLHGCFYFFKFFTAIIQPRI